METTDINSNPNFISDENLDLFSFFASRRRLSRWQHFPFSIHCHFLLFSQCGIDFISCFALQLTHGVPSLTPYLSRNRAVSLLVQGKKGWWSASVIASVFPDLFSLLHKWNRDHPLRYTISIHTRRRRGRLMELEFLLWVTGSNWTHSGNNQNPLQSNGSFSVLWEKECIAPASSKPCSLLGSIQHFSLRCLFCFT